MMYVKIEIHADLSFTIDSEKIVKLKYSTEVRISKTK